MALTPIEQNDIFNFMKNIPIVSFNYITFISILKKRRKGKKVNEIEIFEYFIKYVIDKFQKDDKVYPNILKKYILTINEFLKLNHEYGIQVDDKLLDYIRNFQNLYEEYLERTGFKLDEEFLETSIKVVLNTINELYPVEVSENRAKYINQVLSLEDEIKRLKRELSEIKSLSDSFQNNYEKKDLDYKNLADKKNSLEITIKNKEFEIQKLKDTINLLRKQLIDFENSYISLQEENQSLYSYKEQLEELTIEVKELKRRIDSYELLKIQENKLQEREKEIEKLIYQKILFEKVSISEILKYLNDHKIISDKEEISEILKKIRSKISITNGFSSLGATYKVNSPRILKNGKFTVDIPSDTKYYDIMLVSDFHIREINKETLNLFDILNNYCVKNNINLILNLGDFFEGDKFNYEFAIENYNLLEQAINKIPQVDNLYHAILGGNHEKKILRYGFDPLETLSQGREDFLNLGYTHSTIILNNLNNTLGCFDIHHPDVYDFQIKLESDGIDDTLVKKYLNDIYVMQGRDRNDSYIDILGHTHKNQFNYISSYYYITSFMNRINSGACHLRIYFDKDKIKYMVFMPLNISDRLVKNNEIIYQKIR